MTLTRKDFPANFKFGAATSAYQIEGNNFGGAGRTHWDRFAEIPGKVVNNEHGGVACDHYHRFEDDLDLLKGFDAYRFSTNWARVLPEGRGAVNQQGLDFYDRLVDAVLARGLDPFLTLYHWELPETLAQQGGWRHPDIADWFTDYAEIVMRKIGDRVASTATFNEPWCITYLSHFLGHHAPGLTDTKATALSVHNVLKSHGKAMDSLRASGFDNLGIVLNFEAAYPASQTPKDQTAHKRYDAIMNRLFLEPLMCGTYPPDILDEFEPHFPANWQDDMALISQPMDWLGVNYYTQKIVAAAPNDPWPSVDFVDTDKPKTQMDWDIHPTGLFDILSWITSEFGSELPLYVTENGMARADVVEDGKVNDPERSAFFQDHIEATHKAMQSGTNVNGFFYWSLLDNFEWAFGYEKRFGLVHVDFETQLRTPKQSYFDYLGAFAR